MELETRKKDAGMPAGHLYCKLYTKHVFVACRMQLGVALVNLTSFTLLPEEIDFFL